MNSGRSYTSPISNLPPADQLPPIGHPNFKINSAVRGMSWLPESSLACCISSNTKDTESWPSHGGWPWPQRDPSRSKIGRTSSVSTLCAAARVEWPGSAAFWPSQWVDYHFGSSASWQVSQLRLGFLIYQGWAEQQEAGVSCQGFFSLCAQQGLKVETLAVKLLFGHKVSSYCSKYMRNYMSNYILIIWEINTAMGSSTQEE